MTVEKSRRPKARQFPSCLWSTMVQRAYCCNYTAVVQWCY